MLWRYMKRKCLYFTNPFPQGHLVPEMHEAIVYGRWQAASFHFPKKVCLIYLHCMCLIKCEWEFHSQEICQDVCLTPIVPDRKCTELWVLLLICPCHTWFWAISWETEYEPCQSPSLWPDLIKTYFKLVYTIVVALLSTGGINNCPLLHH